MIFKKHLFCPVCGNRLKKGNPLCEHCGFAWAAENPFKNVPETSGRTGWSSLKCDIRFKKYKRDHITIILIWAISLAFLIPGILLITGNISKDESWVAVILTIMFLGIGFVSAVSVRRKGTEWVGTVIDKYDNRTAGSNRYTIYFLTEDYTQVIKNYSSNIKYDYFKISDLVRMHDNGLIRYLEKFDKSQDEIIFCAACNYLMDIRADYCQACGCPLLK